MATNPLADQPPEEALIGLCNRGIIILETIKRKFEEQRDEGAGGILPNEFSEIVEGIGVFSYWETFCRDSTLRRPR